MNPAPFAYHRAGSVAEAIGLLQQFGGEGKLLAGGHSLLPIMKLRLAEPAHLIDLSTIEALRGISERNGEIAIGAMTTHRGVAQSDLLVRQAPVLAEAAASVGDRQVRNRGTIGGAVAHGDAAADYPAALLALDAVIVAEGPNGERVIAAADFFVDFLVTALEPDEVVTEIRFAPPPMRSGGNYQKLANQASGYALVGVAAQVTLTEDGRFETARIGVTGAIPAARRATGVEDALTGQAATEATITGAATHASESLDLLSDLHASAEYRDRVLQGLTKRALSAAVAAATTV